MSHVLFFVTEPGLPKEALALGFAAHLAYGWLFQTFPMLKVLSPSFLASIALLVASQYLWVTHFTAQLRRDEVAGYAVRGVVGPFCGLWLVLFVLERS